MVAVIINPVAGTHGRRAAVQQRAELAVRVGEACGEAVEVFVTESRGHARELARVACSRGARLVAAWGGDGTVNEVASALAFGKIPLGVIPAGSGNGLAHVLGVPADPEPALVAALRGTARAIDVGEIGGRLFVNLAGIGFDAHVASRFNDPSNQIRGLAGYTMLTVSELFRYRTRQYVIAEAESRRSVRALLVVISNGTEFGNGIRIAPGARVDDGKLDLVLVEERWRLVSLAHVPRLLAGTLDRAGIWSSRRIDRVTIESDVPMVFHVDGEPIRGGACLDARVHPGALRVSAGGA